MGLKDLAIKSQNNRWNDRLGIQEWVVNYSLPNDRLVSERDNYAVSLSNILPWAGAGGLYAPCIHQSTVQPDPNYANSQVLTVLYRRPSERMILQPGRGVLRYDTYETTKVEERPDFRRRVDAQKATTKTGEPINELWDMSGIETETTELGASSSLAYGVVATVGRTEVITIEVRGLVIVVATDWASKELALYSRAASWLGYGGAFTAKGHSFNHLKLTKVEIKRHPQDVSMVNSTWQFAQKDDSWEKEATTAKEQREQEEWYATDSEGNELSYDPYAVPPVIPEGAYTAFKLRNADSDVIKGYKSFSAMGSYFTWMS